MEKKRIIIVGGGFGGVKCAGTLCRHLGSEEAEIVLFNAENHLVFSPLLAEVVGSSINPMDVVVPLRQLLPGVFCRTEEVQGVDTAANQIVYNSETGQGTRMKYDHLVIACGNVTNLQAVPGMADQAFPLKTVGDAAALRSHIIEKFETAEVCESQERRCWHLTFLVVGGGYSGVEAAGEINDLARVSAKYFRNWRASDVKVVLIHSRDQILPEISAGLREFARQKMEKAGVHMVLNARVASATPEGVGLQNGEFLKGGTIVCTIGSSPAPMLASLNVAKEKGRLQTDPDMRVRGLQNVWAIGDCAWIVNAQNGEPSPTTGQFAEREGRQVAENILQVMRGEATKPFCFKLLGELCSIGGHSAVADMLGLHLSGFLAWFVWRGVYLFKLPTWGRRLQVGFDWAWLLVFPRDLSHIRTEQTDRVGHAHYAPGDFVFKKGDAPDNFYVVEQGEVEVVRPHDGSNNGDGEVVAVLGPGSFFGERALVGNRPRVMSIRARTTVEVLVLGKNVFAQMSGALGPLRDALAQTLNRRSVDLSKDRPEIYDLLKRTPLKQLMEPVPDVLLKPDTTMSEVSHAFVEKGNEFFYVSSDGATLEGVVTITDLLRGRDSGKTDASTPVKEFMTKNPIAVTMDEDCALAATAIREYRLKTLPVIESKTNRKLVGYLRVRRLMAYIMKHGDEGAKATAKQIEPKPAMPAA